MYSQYSCYTNLSNFANAQKVDGLSTNNESVPYQVPSVPSLTESDHSCDPSYPFNGSFALRFSLPGTSVSTLGIEPAKCFYYRSTFDQPMITMYCIAFPLHPDTIQN